MLTCGRGALALRPSFRLGESCDVFDQVNVLLVDDNAHMRTLLAEILKAVGVTRPREASDGAEAFEMLRAGKFDVVFTDISMKPMDGIEFTRLLRTSPSSPNPYVPIVMITGHSTGTRVTAARDAGANEFLAKPVTAKNVLDRLRLIINHPRPFVRTPTYFGPDRRRRVDPDFRGPYKRSTDPGVSAAVEL